MTHGTTSAGSCQAVKSTIRNDVLTLFEIIVK